MTAVLSPSSVLNALSHHTFLSGMGIDHLEKLAPFTKERTMIPGQLLAVEGELAGSFFLIESGRIAVEINSQYLGRMQLQKVGRGEIVGWSWLTPPYRWQFNARVMEKGQVLAVDAKCLRLECERDHDLGYELLKRLVSVISTRLNATRREVSHL
jgi:CRP/FNR family cyclic AMP-dependent transcriptional regulator